MKYVLLLWAALAVAVAGCGSEGDRDGDRNGNGPVIEQVKDPVCGMTCDRNDALRQSYHGRDYYFCSEGCMRNFRDNPGRYVGTSSERYPQTP